MRGIGLLVVVGLAVAALPATAAGGSGRPASGGGTSTPLSGTVTAPVGDCGAHIISYDPVTGKLVCTGGDVFGGTMIGNTTWTMTGAFDSPADGLSSSLTARVKEVFTGRIGRRHGTLTFEERLWQEPALPSGYAFQIRGHIVASSGQLAGSRGSVIWIGHNAADFSGKGTYVGFLRQARHGH